MTENNNHEPRHLNDITAMMPAVPVQPKHARPETGELRRPLPPLPSRPDGVAPPPTEAPRVTRAERREMERVGQHLPWWKRWLGLTK